MSLYEFIFGKPSMTSDYIGSHGEFDRNDEDRANCEDMFGMRAPDCVMQSGAIVGGMEFWRDGGCGLCLNFGIFV